MSSVPTGYWAIAASAVRIGHVERPGLRDEQSVEGVFVQRLQG